MKAEQLQNIKEVTKKICRLGAVAVITLVTCDSIKEELSRKIRYNGIVDYGDAVDAIMNSDMLGSYKKEATTALIKHQSSSFYKAIINIVNSDMLGSYKVETIKQLCQKD